MKINWQGKLDLNQRILESKSRALPAFATVFVPPAHIMMVVGLLKMTLGI